MKELNDLLTKFNVRSKADKVDDYGPIAMITLDFFFKVVHPPFVTGMGTEVVFGLFEPQADLLLSPNIANTEKRLCGIQQVIGYFHLVYKDRETRLFQ